MPLTASTPPPVGPPWLAILLACVAAVGTVLTAVMPAVVERIKAHRATPRPAPPAPTLSSGESIGRADRALELLGESMADLRGERDRLRDERDELATELQRMHDLVGERFRSPRRTGGTP